jgi:hypothetical protein
MVPTLPTEVCQRARSQEGQPRLREQLVRILPGKSPSRPLTYPLRAAGLRHVPLPLSHFRNLRLKWSSWLFFFWRVHRVQV